METKIDKLITIQLTVDEFNVINSALTLALNEQHASPLAKKKYAEVKEEWVKIFELL